MEDTSPAARRRYFELLAQRSPMERLAMAMKSSAAVRALATASIRAESPEVSDRALQQQLANRLYGRAVAERLFPGT